MEVKKNKYICMLMAVIMAFIIIGCGKTKNTSVNETDAKTEATTEPINEMADTIKAMAEKNITRTDEVSEETWNGEPFVYVGDKKIVLPMKVKDFFEITGYKFDYYGEGDEGNGINTMIPARTDKCVFNMVKDGCKDIREMSKYTFIECDLVNPTDEEIKAENGYIVSIKVSASIGNSLLNDEPIPDYIIKGHGKLSNDIGTAMEITEDGAQEYYGAYFNEDSKSDFFVGTGDWKARSDTGNSSISVIGKTITQVNASMIFPDSWKITIDYHGMKK